jgi:hypothetical protein
MAQMQATASLRVPKKAASFIKPIGPRPNKLPILKMN